MSISNRPRRPKIPIMAAPPELSTHNFYVPYRVGSPPALVSAEHSVTYSSEPQWEESSTIDTHWPSSFALVVDEDGFASTKPHQQRLPVLRRITPWPRIISPSPSCSLSGHNRQIGKRSRASNLRGQRNSNANVILEPAFRPCCTLQQYLKDDTTERMESLCIGLPGLFAKAYRERVTRILENADAIIEGRPIPFNPSQSGTKSTQEVGKVVSGAGGKFKGSIGLHPPSLISEPTVTDYSVESINSSRNYDTMPSTQSLPSLLTVMDSTTDGIELLEDSVAKVYFLDTKHYPHSNAELVGLITSDIEPIEMAMYSSFSIDDLEYLQFMVARINPQTDQIYYAESLDLEEGGSSSDTRDLTVRKHCHDNLSFSDTLLESMFEHRSPELEAANYFTIYEHGLVRISHTPCTELKFQQSIVQYAGNDGYTSVGSLGDTPTTNTLPSTNTSLSLGSNSNNRVTASKTNNDGCSDNDDDDERSFKPPGSTRSSRTPKSPESTYRCILCALHPEKHTSCIGNSFKRRHILGHIIRVHVRCEHCGKWLAQEKNPFCHLPECLKKSNAHEKDEINGDDKVEFIGLCTLSELWQIYDQTPKIPFEELWDKWWKVLSTEPVGDPTPTSAITLETSKLPEVWNLTMEIYEDGVSSGEFEAINDAQREGLKNASERALSLYGHLVKKKEKRKLSDKMPAARKQTKRIEKNPSLQDPENSLTVSLTTVIAQNIPGGTNIPTSERSSPDRQRLPSIGVTPIVDPTLVTSAPNAEDYTSQPPSHGSGTETNKIYWAEMEKEFQLQTSEPPGSNSGQVRDNFFQPYPGTFQFWTVESNQAFHLAQSPFDGSPNNFNPCPTGMATQLHQNCASTSASPCQACSNSYVPSGISYCEAGGVSNRRSEALPNDFKIGQQNTEADIIHSQSPDIAASKAKSSFNIGGFQANNNPGDLQLIEFNIDDYLDEFAINR